MTVDSLQLIPKNTNKTSVVTISTASHVGSLSTVGLPVATMPTASYHKNLNSNYPNNSFFSIVSILTSTLIITVSSPSIIGLSKPIAAFNQRIELPSNATEEGQVKLETIADLFEIQLFFTFIILKTTK